MKNSMLILFSAFALSAAMPEENYKADVSKSNVHWLGKKTTGQHEGDVKLKSGFLKLDKKSVVGGQFVIDMNTITCTDIEDKTDAQHLVDHLKNEDFFNTTTFPEAVISIKKMSPTKSKDQYTAIADLTIKGIKNEISFPVTLKTKGGTLTAEADITIDRTKWKVEYKSKTIFSSLGDKFIYDDMYFKVQVVLNQ